MYVSRPKLSYQQSPIQTFTCLSAYTQSLKRQKYHGANATGSRKLDFGLPSGAPVEINFRHHEIDDLMFG